MNTRATDTGDAEPCAAQFAQLVVVELAPDEAVLFDELAAAYFRNPKAAVKRAPGHRDIGVGAELLILTPFILAAAQAVVAFLGEVVREAAKAVLVDVAKADLPPTMAHLIRAFFKTAPHNDAEDRITLTPEQEKHLLATIRDTLTGLKLPADLATSIEAGIVGRLRLDTLEPNGDDESHR